MERKFSLKIFLPLVLVLLLFGTFVYKFAAMQKYKTENIDINTKSIFNSTINITYNGDSSVTKFDEMSYHDYFSDYVDKEGLNFKVKYNENGEIVSYYNITKEEQLINMLSVDSFEIATDVEEIDSRKYFTEKNMKKFLDKKNIKDDIDLIKYIKDNYYLRNDLLMSTDTMRNNYIINSLVQSSFPNFESITLINGDKVKGYIVNIKSNPLKAIHLLHEDKQYVIALFGDEVTTDEFIKNLLGSISFN